MLKVSTLLILLSTIALPLRAHDSVNDSFATERGIVVLNVLCRSWVSEGLLKKGQINSLDDSKETIRLWMTYLYDPMLKKGMTEKEYLKVKNDEFKVAYDFFESIEDIKEKKQLCYSAIVKQQEYRPQFFDHQKKYHAKKTVPVSTETQTDKTSKVHDECLNAKDYKGCVEVKSGASSNPSTVTTCAPYTWCEPGTGTDELGLPMISGWRRIYMPDKQTIQYRGPITKLTVRGKTGRYIENESIFRYNVNPSSGTPATKISFGNGNTMTRCESGYNSVNCTTRKPAEFTIPGTEATTGGIRSVSHRLVVDCKDKTFVTHMDGRTFGRWAAIKGSKNAPAKQILDSICSNVDNLPLSNFDKYK